MTKYAKKKVTAKATQRKKSKNSASDQISMSASKRGSSISRTPRQTKRKNERVSSFKGFLFSAAVLLFCVSTFLIINLIHPIGTLEYISSSLSALGSGKYPVSLDGGETLQLSRQNSTYHVLSKTNIDVFGTGGKPVLTSQHGFLNPVLKTSDVRYLVYDQGGKGLKIFNNTKTLVSKKYDNEIIAATIGKNGTYAVSTRTEGYQSAVTVTNKNEKNLFEWYCVDEIINEVALSDNGKTLVTASLKVENGKFNTTVNVLKYNSATPMYSYQFDDVVLSIEVSGNNRAVVALNDKLIFINLKNGSTTNTASNYQINVFKRFGNSILTCSSLAANKQETQVTLYRFNGDVIDNFNFSLGIDDISYFKGNYFILSDSIIYRLTKKGVQLMSKECSFDVNSIVALSADSVATVSYSKIEKYSLAGG